MIFGYARISTSQQKTHSQTDALQSAGAERIFSDVITGTSKSRPQLNRLLEQLREGDTVIVTKYDRLSRSLQGLLDTVDTIGKKGADFRSLAEDVDTSTPAGRLVFHVMSSIAQFERERIAERTREGLAAARKRGKFGGRPPTLTDAQRAEVIKMKREGRRLKDIAALFSVSESTIKRVKVQQ